MLYKVDALYVRQLVEEKIDSLQDDVEQLWGQFRSDLQDWEERKDEFSLQFQLELERWAGKTGFQRRFTPRPKLRGSKYEVYGTFGRVTKTARLERDSSSFPGNRREVIELRMLHKIRGYLEQVEEGCLNLTLTELRYFNIDFSKVLGVVSEGANRPI